MVELTFKEMVQRPFPDLPHAALLLAKELAYPQLDIPKSLRQLDDLADRAAARVRLNDSTAVRAELLSDFLFKQEQFRGNTAVYDDPRNSYLNDILERRLGIPISLSVLYLAIAERLQLPAFGVGLPGHFIVGVAAQGNSLFFDPFHGGGRLSAADCARLVELTVGYTGAFQTEWLTAVSTHDILARMLNNLRIIFTQRHQWAEAIAVVGRMQHIQPNNPHHLRELGVIHYQQGNMHHAATLLDAYLQKAPNAADAQTIRQGIAQALDKWASQN
ncbi:SirB1 family protein [Candidatus Leptofilum sp.]|uniref:SirB1 family protein n=1 Tax=Candidatus Leptofilum sp. TaxID=3241576 RepID=UPI003B5CC55F